MNQEEIDAIASCQKGELLKFELLYEKYIKKIYDFVFYKTHHKELAEDLCSKIFMKALEHIDGFEVKKGTFQAWIYRIARNTVIDHYRTKKQDKNIDDVWDLAGDENVESDAEKAIRLDAVKKVLSGLSAKQRDVILLRLWHGYAFAEIAQILGMTEAACKMQYKRGMTTVRSDLVLVLFFLLFSL